MAHRFSWFSWVVAAANVASGPGGVKAAGNREIHDDDGECGSDRMTAAAFRACFGGNRP